MKTCSKCKITKDLSEFNKTKTNKDGLSYLCIECNRNVTKSYREKNKDRYYANQKEKRETLSVFLSQLLYNAKTRATKKGMPFSVDSSFVSSLLKEQDYRCSVTGLPLSFSTHSRKKANPFKASLDRIDSNGGYTTDNVRFVCWAVNQMKADRTDEEFKYWIETLYMAISSQASNEEGSTTIPQGSTLK